MTELDYSMDNNVSDKAAPQEVSATNISRNENNISITLSRVDNGTDYEYYVEGINKSNGTKLTSNTTKSNYKSEVKGYSYVIEEESLTKETLTKAVFEVQEHRKDYIDAMNKSDLADPIQTIMKLIEENRKK